MHKLSAINVSSHDMFPLILRDSHIYVSPHSQTISQKTVGATLSECVQVWQSMFTNLSNCFTVHISPTSNFPASATKRVHVLGWQANSGAVDGVYMSIDSVLSWSRRLASMSKCHGQILWASLVKFPMLSVSCSLGAIVYKIWCHSQKLWWGGFSLLGNINVDPVSSGLLFSRYPLSIHFPPASRTSDRYITYWCSRTLFILRSSFLSVMPKYSTAFINHLSPVLGGSIWRSRMLIFTLKWSTFSQTNLSHDGATCFPYFVYDSWNGWDEIPISMIKSSNETCSWIPMPDWHP